MYTHHFGLSAEPFSLTPDPALLYRGPGHSEALAALRIGLQGRRGLMVMTGEVGTGKTTLLYSLLAELGSDTRTAYLSNTKLGFDDMLRLTLADLNVPCEPPDRVTMLTGLNALLRECAKKGETVALIVDEAQNLDDEVFEHLRLLSNFETFQAKLLQIVLVGQPELEAKLRRPSLRQVAERVAVHCRIEPLSRRESHAYVEHRLRCVGGSQDLFTPAALRLAVARSGGVPRRINILCHTALLFAYGGRAPKVTRSMVRSAARERRRLVRTGSFAPSPLRWAMGTWLRAAVTAGALLAVAGVAGALRWSGQHEPAAAAPAAPVAAAAPEAIPDTAADKPVAAVAEVHDRPEAEAMRPDTHPEDPAGAAAEPPSPVSLPVDTSAGEPAVAAALPPPSDPVSTLEVIAEPPSGEDVAGGTPQPVEDPAARVRLVRVAPGATLSSLVRDFYGSVDDDLLARVRSVNPHVVDPDRVLAGDLLRFPECDPSGRCNDRNQ